VTTSVLGQSLPIRQTLRRGRGTPNSRRSVVLTARGIRAITAPAHPTARMRETPATVLDWVAGQGGRALTSRRKLADALGRPATTVADELARLAPCGLRHQRVARWWSCSRRHDRTRKRSCYFFLGSGGNVNTDDLAGEVTLSDHLLWAATIVANDRVRPLRVPMLAEILRQLVTEPN
jgi:hypothetical protein